MTKDKDMVNWKELTEADRKSYQAGHNASMKRHKEAIVAKDAEILALKSQASGLAAARAAYASEFPPTADGDPDVDNIRAYIRGMKAEIAALKKDAERYRFASEHLILSGGTTKFGWPIAPATKAEWDRYLDATIAKAVKP